MSVPPGLPKVSDGGPPLQQPTIGFSSAQQAGQPTVGKEQQEVSWKGHTAKLLLTHSRQASVKDLTVGVYQELILSAKESRQTSNPEILKNKKEALKELLSQSRAHLNTEEKHWTTTAKRVILLALSFLVIPAPLTYRLYLEVNKDAYALKRDFLEKALSLADGFDGEVESFEIATELHKLSLPIQNRDKQEVIERLKYRRDQVTENEPNPPEPRQVGVLTLGEKVMDDLQRGNIASISVEGSAKPPESYQNLPTSSTSEQHQLNIRKFGHRLETAMDAKYGSYQEKQNILSNLLPSLTPSRFAPETKKIKEEEKASGREISASVLSTESLQNVIKEENRVLGLATNASEVTSYHHTATIGTKTCTQMSMGILKIQEEDPDKYRKDGSLKHQKDGAVKYQVVMMQNQIPLHLMKLSPEELDAADSSEIISRTIRSQEFDSATDALAYFQKAQPLATDGSLFTYMQNTPAPTTATHMPPNLTGLRKIKKQSEPMIYRNTSAHQNFSPLIWKVEDTPRRGSIAENVGATTTKIPKYITIDIDRCDSLHVTIQDRLEVHCDPQQEGEEGIEAFTRELSGNLPEESYGTKEQQNNILANLYSTFTQETSSADTALLTTLDLGYNLLATRDLGRRKSEDTVRAYFANVTPSGCVSTAMGIYEITPMGKNLSLDKNNKPRNQKYQVITTQTRAPLSVMQQTRDTPGAHFEGIETATRLSKQFDTLEAALEYMKQARPFAENGLLFIEDGLASLKAPVEEARDWQLVATSLVQARTGEVQERVDGEVPPVLQLTDDTLFNLSRNDLHLNIDGAELSYSHMDPQQTKEEQIKAFGYQARSKLQGNSYGVDKKLVFDDEGNVFDDEGNVVDGDGVAKEKANILNNLVNLFNQEQIVDACVEKSRKLGGEALSRTHTSVEGEWFAEVTPDHCTQTMKHVIREDVQGESSRFLAVVLQSQIPTKIMKMDAASIQASLGKEKEFENIQSKVFFTQAFATKAEALAYLDKPGSLPGGVDFTPTVGDIKRNGDPVVSRGDQPIKDIMAPPEEDKPKKYTEVGGIQMPAYITDDFKRNFMEVSIEGQQEPYSWKRGGDINKFAAGLLSALPADYSEMEKQNIVTNVFSTTMKGGMADQVQYLKERGLVPEEIKPRELLELSPGTTETDVQLYSTKVMPDPTKDTPGKCVSHTMKVWAVSPDNGGIPDKTKRKYQVASVQNEVSLDYMKGSRNSLRAALTEKGTDFSDELQSKLVLSKEFDTFEEALKYFRRAKPFVEDGTLFDE